MWTVMKAESLSWEISKGVLKESKVAFLRVFFLKFLRKLLDKLNYVFRMSLTQSFEEQLSQRIEKAFEVNLQQ